MFRLLILSPLCLWAALEVEIQNPLWNENNWVSHQDDIDICNTQFTSLILDGVRFETQDASNWSNTTGVPGKDKTYDYLLPDYKKRISGGQCLILDNGFSGTPQGADWTPLNTQSLIKTGYCGATTQEPYSSPLSCNEAISSSNNSAYYDRDYCQVDGYGTRGGPMSGGWIDSYEGETQIQVALPQTPFIQNSTYVTFEPKKMGGPMYMMALAMGQEYMHMDMQFLVGIGGGENFAGMVQWETMGDTYGANTGTLLYGTGNNGQNGVDYGPFSIEPSTIGDNVMKSYPSYFPEYPCLSEESPGSCISGHGIAQEYMETPGTGMVEPNAPELVNSVIISGLNFWFIYDLVANATDFCMSSVIREGRDSLAAMKIMGKAYNKGINSAFETPFSDPDAKDLDNITPLLGAGGAFYVEKAMKGSDPLVQSNANSETCGGTDPIYDEWIDLNTLQDFFFGTGGTPQNLGSGGVMHHYYATPETREEMWDEILCTFNHLSNHWGENPQAISYRYDFLTILRVAKKYFSTERPLPTNFTYTNWLKTRTQNPVSCDGTTIDEEYPWWKIESKVQANGVEIEVKTEDNDSISSVQWSIGDDWVTWNQATWLEGNSSGDAVYKIHIPQSLLQDLGLEQSHWVWIRTTDGCGNSTIGKTLIEGQPIPTLDSAIALDQDGDGSPDQIKVYGSEYSGSDLSSAIKLNEYDSLEYQWPDLNSQLKNNPAAFNAGIFTIEDSTLRSSSGRGQATLHISGGPLTTPILDRIGPVIQFAAITEYPEEPSSDTLMILFSESIQLNNPSDNIYLILNGTEIESQNAIHKEGNLYHFVFPRNSIAEGDSVKIKVGSHIIDLANNTAQSNNQPKEVVLDKGPLPLAQEGHGYFDRNQDGTVDRIVLNFTRLVEGKVLDLMWNWQDSNGVLQSYPLNSGDAMSEGTFLIWDLDQEWNLIQKTTYYDSTKAQWGLVSIKQNNLQDGSEFIEEVYPEDKMSPIATQAVMVQASEIGKPDNLRVDFSEPIDPELTQSTELYLIHTLGKPDRLPSHDSPNLGRWSTLNQSHTTSYSGPLGDRPLIGDSLSLNSEEAGVVTDQEGNSAVLYNPPVLIKGEATIQFFSPNITEMIEEPQSELIAFFPSQRDDYYDQKQAGVGFDFAFQDVAGLDREDISIKFSLSFYSNLGQFVENMEVTLNCHDFEEMGVFGACDPAKIAPSQKISLFQPWDYQDSKGRLVGSGAYIQKAIVSIQRLEEYTTEYNKLIGVRR